VLPCTNYDTMDLKEQLVKYIKDVIGFEINIQQPDELFKAKLPLFLKEEYQWFEALLENKKCILAIVKDENRLGINQIGKQFQKAGEMAGLPVIGVFNHLEAYNRKRLIEKKTAFIVPGKQLYIPEFLMDLREYKNNTKKKTNSISPVAQQLLLLFLLDNHNKLSIETQPFKNLATLLETNKMGITRAVESLKNQNFIETTGKKEKTIRFTDNKQNLWTRAKKQNVLINPVLKQVFTDELPQHLQLLLCNDNALANYTDINPVRQKYYAIEKSMYYALKKTNALVNENNYEGKYCLEVWKYNPATITGLLFENRKAVDPLSLFLCYKGTTDERIEMALEQIENKFIWLKD